MKPNPKALKEARAYILPAIRYCLFDCSDSMYESEKIEARFHAVTDDKVHIGDFIAEHLFDEYIKELKSQLAEYGNGDTVETFSCGVCEPPVPLEVVKRKLGESKPVEKPEQSEDAEFDPIKLLREALLAAQAHLEYCGYGDSWERECAEGLGAQIEDALERTKPEPPLKGKTFVITGTLSAPRKEIAERIEEAGGVVSSSVSAKTDFLVVGEDAGSKVEKARRLGIKMVSENELEEML